MTIPVLEYSSPSAQKPRPLLSLLEKIVLIALGAGLPLICFAICAVQYPFEPDFQVQEWHRYLLFLPDGRAGYPFYPLLLYCIASLCVFVIRPATSRFLIVRLGLYTGNLLALQYTCIQALGVDEKFILIVGIGLVSNLVLFGVVKGLERIPRKVLVYCGIGLAVITVLSAVVPMGHGPMRFGAVPLGAIAAAGVVSLLFAPAWCLGVYFRVSLLAMRLNHRDPERTVSIPLSLLAWVPWLGAYAGAWKWSISNAIVMYSKLPLQSSRCFIATAAAAGHAGFVGSSPVRAADGSIFLANQQLRRLKCVEIAMAVACPALQRVIRRIYDQIGPPLARVIVSHPLLADVAFVALKPVEWMAFGVLVAVVPDARLKMRSLYSLKSA